MCRGGRSANDRVAASGVTDRVSDDGGQCPKSGLERDDSRVAQACIRDHTQRRREPTYRLVPTWRWWSGPSSKISVSSQMTSSATFIPSGKMRCNRSKRADGIWSYLFCSFKS